MFGGDGDISGYVIEKSKVVEEAVSIHYNKFNERGLQVFAGHFKRKGFPVSEIATTDKVVKKDGIPTRKATLVFDAGHVLDLLIAFRLDKDKRNLKGAKLTEALKESKGNIFQAKLNGKKIPVEMPKTSGPVAMRTLDKIIGFLEKSKITKSERQKMVSATQAAEKKAAPKKPTSAAARLNEANARREALLSDLETAKKKLEKANAEQTALTGQRDGLSSELNELLEDNEALTRQLEERGVA